MTMIFVRYGAHKGEIFAIEDGKKVTGWQIFFSPFFFDWLMMTGRIGGVVSIYYLGSRFITTYPNPFLYV